MTETFVVRVWTPGDADEAWDGELRGFVEHVGEPGRHAFAGTEELVAAIRSRVEQRIEQERSP